MRSKKKIGRVANLRRFQRYSALALAAIGVVSARSLATTAYTWSAAQGTEFDWDGSTPSHWFFNGGDIGTLPPPAGAVAIVDSPSAEVAFVGTSSNYSSGALAGIYIGAELQGGQSAPEIGQGAGYMKATFEEIGSDGAAVAHNESGEYVMSGGTNEVTSNLVLAPSYGETGFFALNALNAPTLIVDGQEQIGNGGSANFSQEGGQNTAGDIRIGEGAFAQGVYTQLAGSLNAGSMEVFGDADGTGAQSSFTEYGNVTLTGALQVGLNEQGVDAYYELENGNLRTVSETVIGDSYGTAEMVQNNGTNTTYTLTVAGTSGAGNGNSASYTLGQLSGAIVSTLTVNGDENIGNVSGDTGYFTQTAGTHTVGGTMYVGNVAGSTGFYNQSGGSTTLGNMSVGNNGTGTFTLSGDGFSTVNVNYLGFGGYAGSVGTYTQSGGRLTVNNQMYVGLYGQGIYNQSGGFTSTGDFFVGYYQGGSGTATISNAGILMANNAYIGGNNTGAAQGPGVVNINAGGTMEVDGAMTIYDTPGTTVNLDGGSLYVGSINTSNPTRFNWTTGSLAYESPLTIGPGGPLGSSLTLNSGQTLNDPGALVTTSGPLTVNSGAAFYPNQWANSAIVTAALGSTIEVTTTGNATGLDNSGTITSNSNLVVDGSLTNEVGGQIGCLGFFSVGAGATNNGKLTTSGNAIVYGNMSNGPGAKWQAESYAQVLFGDLDNYGTVKITGGGFHVGGNFTNEVGGQIQAIATSFGVDASVTNNGNITTGGEVSFGGNLTNGAGAEWQIESDAVVEGTVDNYGLMKITDGDLEVFGNFTNEPGATVETTGATATFNGATNVLKGMLEPDPSTLTFNGSTTFDSTFTASLTPGDDLIFNGDVVNNANFSINGASITVNGGMSGSGSITNSGNGELTLGTSYSGNQNLTNSAGGTMNVPSGATVQLTGLGWIVNNGTFNLSGGTITATSSAQVQNNPGGTLNGPGTLSVAFTNYGNVVIPGGTLSLVGNTNNYPGATIQLGGVAMDYSTLSNSGILYNYGTIRGVGSINAGLLINHGMIQVDEQSMSLPANLTNGTDGTLATASSTAMLNVPSSFTSDGTIHANGGAIEVAGTVSGVGNIVVEDASYFSADHIQQNSLTINGAGMVQLLGDGTPTASTLNSLNMGTLATLDLTNTRLIIDYGSGPDPIASIAQWIANGFYGLPGPAIISSDIATDDALSGFSYGIGYADGADGLVAGLPSGEIEIAYTLLGDANLDGTVNTEDFTPFSHNLGQPGGWDRGDFNYDGIVNTEDFTPFSHDLNQTAVLAGVLDLANGLRLTNVPEPGVVGLLLPISYCVLLNRRRRNVYAG